MFSIFSQIAVLEIQQAVTNMKTEFFQDQNSSSQEIYQEEEDHTHLLYQEETNVEIFNENASEEMYNQDEINHEIYDANTAQNEIYQSENSSNTEQPLSNQTEETIIQEDRNFYEENNEEGK